MVKGKRMIVPGPKMIKMIKSDAGKTLYERAQKEEWSSYILGPLIVGILDIEDEMIGETMIQDIYSLSEDYNFEGVEEGVSIALFAILKELKTLNTTLKKMEKE
jgi:hypothetical protein